MTKSRVNTKDYSEYYNHCVGGLEQTKNQQLLQNGYLNVHIVATGHPVPGGHQQQLQCEQPPVHADA